MSAVQYSAELKKEVDISTFIPYGNHITQNTVKLVSGDYVQTLRLQGAAHESADVQDINNWHEGLNNFLRNIASPHIAVWTHLVRREFGEYPASDFPNGFAKDFNDKYREKMGNTKMLINELYVSIVYRPNPLAAAKMFGKLGKKSPEELREITLDELQTLDDAVGAAEASLARYEPELLGCYQYNGYVFSELGEFLSFLIDGQWRRFPLPRAQLRNVLATNRPFFGKGGRLAWMTPTETYLGACLAIAEYPDPTYPGILNELLSVPFEYVLSQSFTFNTKQAALGRMKRQQARMINAGDVAESQVDAITQAMDDLVSNKIVMGAHSLSLVIRTPDDPKLLNMCINLAGNALSEVGIKWQREDIACPGAFWAQLPGNFSYRVSPADISSRNFAAFSCFHNYPIGRLHGNQWGEAVMMLKTVSGGPYYFNFHHVGEDREMKKVDPDHKDLANTVVIGKSGTGKTVLEMTMLTMLQKYHLHPDGKRLTAVVFDKDLGASIGVRALGGKYYPLKNGVPSGFNPLQLEPTPNNLTFVEKLVRQLVKRENMPLTPGDEKRINEAIIGVMGDPSRGINGITQSKRRLNAVLEFFDPTDENGLYGRLEKWCRGGALGWLFDNPEDTLDVNEAPIIGFDVTEFIENDETRTPTIMYLFHRIESLIDGRRIPIFMDEFWKLLDDEAFEDLANNKLATIRKQDGFLVMFTQNPAQVLGSKIAKIIITQTATKVFLPNPEADYNDYVNGFKLTQREYEIVRSLGEKSRQFLVKQGENSVVCELSLPGFGDELAVLSGNTATSLLAERLVRELGDNPDTWLPEFQRVRKNG